MAAGKLTLRQLGLLRRCLGPGGVAKAARMSGPLIQTRNGSTNDPAPWNYLWAPGKYPQTEEEMVAAAKKYGMIREMRPLFLNRDQRFRPSGVFYREDYVPYPDNGDGMGDYPDIGRCSGAKRPGLKWWDDEDYKRDHGQVMGFDWYHTLEVGWDSCDYKDRYVQVFFSAFAF